MNNKHSILNLRSSTKNATKTKENEDYLSSNLERYYISIKNLILVFLKFRKKTTGPEKLFLLLDRNWFGNLLKEAVQKIKFF